jgi:hypothetical protein
MKGGNNKCQHFEIIHKLYSISEIQFTVECIVQNTVSFCLKDVHYSFETCFRKDYIVTPPAVGAFVSFLIQEVS